MVSSRVLMVGLSFFSAGWMSATSLWAHTPKKTEISGYQQVSIELYIKKNQNDWFKQDLSLMAPAPTKQNKNGWKKVKGHKVKDEPMSIYKRKDPSGNANNLFYYWDDISLNIPLDVAAKMFFSWVDLSHNWTKELTKATQLLGNDSYQVWHQHFDPKMVFVHDRDLVSSCVIKNVSETDLELIPKHDLGERRAKIISCRSLPDDLGGVPEKEPKVERIDWHGAFLLIEHADSITKVRKIDREDTGGSVPAWAANMALPKFLEEEVLRGKEFVDKHKNELTKRHLFEGL